MELKKYENLIKHIFGFFNCSVAIILFVMGIEGTFFNYTLNIIAFLLTLLSFVCFVYLIFHNLLPQMESIFGLILLYTIGFAIFSSQVFYKSGYPEYKKITRFECFTLANCSNYQTWNQKVDENIDYR